ncbi:MAG: metallophosphoesterase [Clostridia bacterium]|nr:metallophosphoesterase [Clostridia bacterium]
MTILVLSDSHGHRSCVSDALDRVRPDAVLFAGDGLRDFADLPLPCPLYAVRGNCDWAIDSAAASVPDEDLVTIGGIRIFLCHGHKYGVRTGPGAAAAAALRLGADVLVYGHTHEALEMTVGPEESGTGVIASRRLLICNPGSIGEYPHSFGTLTVQGGQVLFACGDLCDTP